MIDRGQQSTAAGQDAKLRREVMAGVWPIDRVLWRKALERNLRQPNSKLLRNIQRYGPRGAALGVTGILWSGYVGLAGMTGAVIYTVIPRHSSGQVVVYVLWGMAAVFFFIGFAHVIGGSAAGKRWRAPS
jgi:hypothetical protein